MKYVIKEVNGFLVLVYLGIVSYESILWNGIMNSYFIKEFMCLFGFFSFYKVIN